jgi:hypothetical protein
LGAGAGLAAAGLRDVGDALARAFVDALEDARDPLVGLELLAILQR